MRLEKLLTEVFLTFPHLYLWNWGIVFWRQLRNVCGTAQDIVTRQLTGELEQMKARDKVGGGLVATERGRVQK